MVFESLGATAIVWSTALGWPTELGTGQAAGWLAVVTSGEIAFHVRAPSFVCHRRQVPKYNVWELFLSRTRGGIKLPRSVPSMPLAAKNPFPINPSPANVTPMIRSLLGMYSHSP